MRNWRAGVASQRVNMGKVHWLALSTLPGVGSVTFKRLIERFGSVEAIFDASDAALRQIPRFTAVTIAHLRSLDLASLEADLASLDDEGIQVVTWEDADYPTNLLAVPDAPPILYVRGTLTSNDNNAVAIVGTRQPSPRGADVAAGLACELAARGLTIVSGLALGIDTAAHWGALNANGRTLAVLGSGVRVIHPPENQRLAEEITRHGALLSEFHPNTPPRGPQLMARDRIISGLSRTVIVVEASENSGSLDTADKGRRQGRRVLAVPGSPGTDALIAQGVEALDPDSIHLDDLATSQTIIPTSPPDPPKQLSLW